MTATDKEMLGRRLAGVLPKISIAGQPFIIDWRLKELRHEYDLGARLNLRNMAMSADGEKYLCFYHLPSKREIKIGDGITKLPEDTVMLEIPYELKLDPVAVAREYGLDDKYMLEAYPIQAELKAAVIPLEDTGLPELIRQNRQKIKNGNTVKALRRSKRRGI